MIKYQKILLKDLSTEFINSNAYIERYELSFDNDFVNEQPFVRPGLVILPGGGYRYCSSREAEPIALRFLLEGFNCFVLNYTCQEVFPIPYKEVAFTLDYLKRNHAKFHILDKNLSLVGFSAGGHLAASYATVYEEIGRSLNLNIENLKPFALILGYPVITLSNEINTHSNTRDVITNNKEELIEKLSVEKHITSDYPHTYVFSTKDDAVVNVKNSYMLLEELEKHNVIHKERIFENGLHGGSLYTRAVYAEFGKQHLEAEKNSIWASEAAEFLNKLIF